MSVEERALSLYEGETLLGEDIPIPIRRLIVNEPQAVNYTLKNECPYPIEKLKVTVQGNDDVAVKMNTSLPDELKSSESTPLILTWTLKRTPKIHGDEPLANTTMQASYDINLGWHDKP